MANSETTSGLPPLIPRELLLGNPERALPKISPDGTSLAWVAPDPRRVLQVWVQTLGKDDARIVTADRKRGVTQYGWSWDSGTILYGQDSDGDENYHLFAADLATRNVRDLTPWQGVRAEPTMSNPRFPTQILIPLNIRDRALMDVYRIDLRTGAVELDTENPGDVAEWLADDNLTIRAAFVMKPDGSSEIRVRDGATAPWRTIVSATPDEEATPLGFRPPVGTRDAKRSDRRGGMGSARGNRGSAPDRNLGHFLWRLRVAGGRDLHTRCLSLRNRRGRAVKSVHPVAFDSRILGTNERNVAFALR